MRQEAPERKGIVRNRIENGAIARVLPAAYPEPAQSHHLSAEVAWHPRTKPCGMA